MWNIELSRTSWVRPLALVLGLSAAGCSPLWAKDAAPAQPAAAKGANGAKAALSVEVVSAQTQNWPLTVAAQGSLAAWQEASVGAEGGPWRLDEVRVQVGDAVKKGQVLAQFASQTVQAELAQARAAAAEAQAMLGDAQAKARRARELQPTGVLSAEQIQSVLAAEQAAQARVQTTQAVVSLQELRLQQTEVRAPDDGLISARTATVGAVVPPGMELFRLIRQGRLEWRAEVPADDLVRLQVGAAVQLQAAGGLSLEGRVRSISPTVDPATRNGLVYVDLKPNAQARMGMFARGDFRLGQRSALTLPQSSVLLREGFAYVFVLEGADRVRRLKVSVGRRVGDRVEVLEGLPAQAQVVAQGAGFLSDGDTVRVVTAPASAKP